MYIAYYLNIFDIFHRPAGRNLFLRGVGGSGIKHSDSNSRDMTYSFREQYLELELNII